MSGWFMSWCVNHSLAGEVPGSPVKQATSLEQISEGDQLEPDTDHSVPSMTTGTHSMPLGDHDSALMPQHSSAVLPAHSSILAMQGEYTYMYNVKLHLQNNCGLSKVMNNVNHNT